MKIYIIVSRYTYESDTEVVVKPFATESKAKEYFNKLVDGEIADSWIADRKDEKDFVLERGESRFTAYPEGYAPEFDTEIWIEEKVVE